MHTARDAAVCEEHKQMRPASLSRNITSRNYSQGTCKLLLYDTIRWYQGTFLNLSKDPHKRAFHFHPSFFHLSDHSLSLEVLHLNWILFWFQLKGPPAVVHFFIWRGQHISRTRAISSPVNVVLWLYKCDNQVSKTDFLLLFHKLVEEEAAEEWRG